MPVAQKSNVSNLSAVLCENVDFLYEAVKKLKDANFESFCNDNSTIFFERNGSDFSLKSAGNVLTLGHDDMKTFLIDAIALFEEILPLGSVVDLKKDEFKDIVDVSNMKEFRVVITKRFLGIGEHCYYTYGTVLYPFGTIGEGRTLSITPAMIEKVVARGYSDDLDHAFVYAMKKSMICDERRVSVGFTPKEELQELQRRLEGMTA